MAEAFSPSNDCSICSSSVEEDEGIKGYFGILPVSFCDWCYSSLTDMIIKMNGLNDIETLQERLKELKEEESYD